MNSLLFDTNDEEIIAAIKAKYLHHVQEAENHKKQSDKFKRMLEAYNGDVLKDSNDKKVIAAEHVKDKVINKVGKERINKQLFENVILDILSDGIPRLSAELNKEYQEKTGIKVDSNDFSAKLSIRAKKGNIKNAKFLDFPVDKRFWWGKSQWFDGNFLKADYVSIIHEKFKNM